MDSLSTDDPAEDGLAGIGCGTGPRDLPLSLARQSVLDTAQRMRTGLLIYPAIWTVLMQVDHYTVRHPVFALLNGLLLLAGTAGRLLYHGGLPARLTRDFKGTRRVFRLMSISYNAYWGLLCGLLIAAPDAPTLRWLALLATVGITAGGTVIVAIDAVLPLLYPLGTLGPTVVMVLPEGGTVNYAVTGLSMVFFAYSLSLSRLVGREYWARLRSQHELEQRARDLEALSRTDALTQIPNRLRFQEALTQAWRDARRRREPLAVAMVDLDYFKHINDTHGHPFGDLCLQAAAKALKAGLKRPGDLVARYGGEEFVVLMPNTDLAGAHAVAEAMLERIRQTYVSEEGHAALLSCSIGIAARQPGHTEHADELVKVADAALYEAKQGGRGRVAGVMGGVMGDVELALRPPPRPHPPVPAALQPCSPAS